MPFLNKLWVTEGPEWNQWRLTAALKYTGKVDHFEIPTGFVTDFASVPRPFWAIFPPNGPWAKAAVVHDWLYRTLGVRVEDVEWHPRHGPLVGLDAVSRPITRREADGIFRRMMRELGVSWWRYTTMYWAVRLGGWFGWGKVRK